MGFFDLNIPYSESSPCDKTNRIKVATMALELGYSGIAYNRTIKGVMSDRDCCSITLLTLSSLLKLAPSLSSSVQFHRDLLGVPSDSPFRQYRRLTVCVDSMLQAQALNSGNPILKTYDFVAVRPMNQIIFDQACEKLEVDIIAIDFSEKLPFRLKLPMVKTAIERGVYFEITYSNLTADIQTRRKMISNAKLLVDWTRGKNLIISSAAPTVFELRGPYDVANLSFLLGLSKERAKAALSKNCRCLITKALRKRQFYKETVKLEVVNSGEQVGLNKPLLSDWFKWDPISSGEGDLMLDDIAKSLAACSEVSKTVKAIDFTSVVESMPSHGFQVKDLISGATVGSQSQANTSIVISTTKVIEPPTLVDGNLEQTDRPDLPVAGQTSLKDAPSKYETFGDQICQKLFYPSDTTTAFADAAEIRSSATTEAELNKHSKSDINIDLIRAGVHDLNPQNAVDGEHCCELHDELPSEYEMHMSGIELGAACDTDSKVESPTTFMYIDLPAEYEDMGLQSSEVVSGRKGDPVDKNFPHVVTENLKDTANYDDRSLQSSEILFGIKVNPADKDFSKVVSKDLKDTSSVLDDLALHENLTEKEQLIFTEKEQLEKAGVDPAILVDQIPILESNDMIRARDNALDEKDEPVEVTMEEQKLEKADNEFNHELKDTPLELDDLALHEKVIEKERLEKPVVDPVILLGQVPVLESDDVMRDRDNASDENNKPPAVTMEEPKHEKADNEFDHQSPAQSVAGKPKTKRKIHHPAFLLPLKRMLSPIPFKDYKCKRKAN